MKKRTFSILLVLALILTALAGCGSPNAADSSESPGTEDQGEHTPAGPDASDMPSGGEETPSDEPGSDHVELPLGCYAGYDDGDLFGYLKVTASTMIFYYGDGEIEGEARYSYDSDGSCALEMDENTVTVQFTYEQDSYYMNNGGESRRLEPISEDEIPTNNAPSDLEAYYIGANGSIALYAWMPEALYDSLSFNYEKELIMIGAECYDEYAGADLKFSALAASDKALRETINNAKADYSGAYSSDADLLFNYLRDNFIASELGSNFSGDINDDYRTISEREWRFCEAYDGKGVSRVLLFWMEGNDMSFVMVGGTVKGSGSYDDMTGIVADIISSLKIDA